MPEISKTKFLNFLRRQSQWPWGYKTTRDIIRLSTDKTPETKNQMERRERFAGDRKIWDKISNLALIE